jgi:hypothetical protein
MDECRHEGERGSRRIAQAVREAAHLLTGAGGYYDPPLGLVGNAPFVLIGEASHGTHEFYRERSQTFPLRDAARNGGRCRLGIKVFRKQEE